MLTILQSSPRVAPGLLSWQAWSVLRAAAHDNGATILVVAHDARMIPHCDRVFHLEDGCLVEGMERPLSLVNGVNPVTSGI